MAEYHIQPRLLEYTYKKCDGDIEKFREQFKNTELTPEDFRAIYNSFNAIYFFKKDAVGVFKIKKAFNDLFPSENFEYLTKKPLNWIYRDLEGCLLNENSSKFFDDLGADDLEKVTSHFLTIDSLNKDYNRFLINLFGAPIVYENCVTKFKDQINDNFDELLPKLYEIECFLGVSKLDEFIGGLPETIKNMPFDLGVLKQIDNDSIKDNLSFIGKILTDDNINKVREHYYQQAINSNEVEFAYEIGCLLGKNVNSFSKDLFSSMLYDEKRTQSFDDSKKILERVFNVIEDYHEDFGKRERDSINVPFNIHYLKRLELNYSSEDAMKFAYNIFNDNEDYFLPKVINLGILHDSNFDLELFRHFYKKDGSSKNFKELYTKAKLKEPNENLLLFASYCKHTDILLEEMDDLINMRAKPWKERVDNNKKMFKKACKKFKSFIKKTNAIKEMKQSSYDELIESEMIEYFVLQEYADKGIKKVMNSKFEHPLTGELLDFDITNGWNDAYSIFNDRLKDIREHICEKMVEKNPDIAICYLTALLNAHQGKGKGWDDEFAYFNNENTSIGFFLKKNIKLKLSKKHGNFVGYYMKGELISEKDVLETACFASDNAKAHFLKDVGDALGQAALNLEVVVDGYTGDNALWGSKKSRAWFNGNVGKNLAEDALKPNITVRGDVGENALINAIKAKAKFHGSLGDNLGVGSKKCRVTVDKADQFGKISYSMLSGKIKIEESVYEKVPVNGFAARFCGYLGAGVLSAGSFLTVAGLQPSLFSYVGGASIVGGGLLSLLGAHYHYSGKEWIDRVNECIDTKRNKQKEKNGKKFELNNDIDYDDEDDGEESHITIKRVRRGLFRKQYYVEMEPKEDEEEESYDLEADIESEKFNEPLKLLEEELGELNEELWSQEIINPNHKIKEIQDAYDNGEITPGFLNVTLEKLKNGGPKNCPICGESVANLELMCPSCSHRFN